MKNVSRRKPDQAFARTRRDRTGIVAVESLHVGRRIGGPALAANVGVKSTVTVGQDIETGKLLFEYVDAERVDILLAVSGIDHGREEAPRAEVFGIPARARQRADDRRRQFDVGSRAKHSRSPRPQLVSRFRRSYPLQHARVQELEPQGLATL